MAIKALFTYNYGIESMKSIEKLGYNIKIIGEKEVVYKEDLKDIEVLVCYNPFETLDISNMNELKWIQLSSAGIDQLPLEYIKKNNILVTNNRGGYSIPIGEWIILKILEMLKHSYRLYENQKNKVWKMDTKILELHGKTVGFIGTGSIAREAAKRLSGFGVNILGLNTSGKEVQYFHRCFSSKDIDKMLCLCDIVVITIPYTEETHHLINRSRFENMKDGVYIINVARGYIIDEKALIDNIEMKKVAAAALDVVEEEPLREDSPLWTFDNVIITPHNSWMSEKRNYRRFNLIYDNMKKYAEGEKLFNLVSTDKGY